MQRLKSFFAIIVLISRLFILPVIAPEIKKIIDTQYERAKSILRKHEDKLHQLANKLLESEVIFKEDLETIFGKRPFEKEVIEEKVKTPSKTTKKVAVTKKISSKKSA